MARPTKLTLEVQQKICEAIRNGAYIETAAALAGISKDTLYAWLRKGARAQGGKFRVFSDAVEKAMAEAEQDDLLIIKRAAQEGIWQAAAWRLERKHPERWGRVDRLQAEIAGKDGGPIQIVVGNLNPAIYGTGEDGSES